MVVSCIKHLGCDWSGIASEEIAYQHNRVNRVP